MACQDCKGSAAVFVANHVAGTQLDSNINVNVNHSEKHYVSVCDDAQTLGNSSMDRLTISLQKVSMPLEWLT